MLAFTLSTLVLSASLASAAYVRPVARQNEPSASVAATCPNGSTSFTCPPGTTQLSAEQGASNNGAVKQRDYVECQSDDLPYSCYYVPEQDWERMDYNPDGTMSENYSGPNCPRFAPHIVTCSPEGKASYACQNPTVVYSCPAGYTQTGDNGKDYTCNNGAQDCYYYSDSGKRDTLTPGFQSPASCPTLGNQAGTCSNSMRRRNGVSKSPAWLQSRQAVIKPGMTARASRKARTA